MSLRTLDAVCFASGNTVTPAVVVAGGGVAANALLSPRLMDAFGHVGIALGTVVAVWLHGLTLDLVRRALPDGLRSLRSLCSTQPDKTGRTLGH